MKGRKTERVGGTEGSGWREKRIIVSFYSERVLFFGAAERRSLLSGVYQWDRSSEITHPDSRPRTWCPQAAGGGLLKIIFLIQHKTVSALTTKPRDQYHMFTCLFVSASQMIRASEQDKTIKMWRDVKRWNSDWTRFHQKIWRLNKS